MNEGKRTMKAYMSVRLDRSLNWACSTGRSARGFRGRLATAKNLGPALDKPGCWAYIL